MSDLTEENIAAYFTELEDFLAKIPGVQPFVCGVNDDKNWWIQFSIDIAHPLAWNVVKELGHVVNYLPPNERLPVIFYPVSPFNGGPLEFLFWIIESTNPEFKPAILAEWLEGRLPRPVEDITLWGETDIDDTE